MLLYQIRLEKENILKEEEECGESPWTKLLLEDPG